MTFKLILSDKACPKADNLEEISKEYHRQEDALQEGIDAASKKPDSQVMDTSTHDIMVDNLNNSAEANFPAPEKLLSVPEDIVDPHNNVLAEMSPGDLVGLDASDAGSKVVSGKKRGFTESTLTEQSLNSVESSRLVRFKGTIESVPNDDDLLSSILGIVNSILFFIGMFLVEWFLTDAKYLFSWKIVSIESEVDTTPFRGGIYETSTFCSANWCSQKKSTYGRYYGTAWRVCSCYLLVFGYLLMH